MRHFRRTGGTDRLGPKYRKLGGPGKRHYKNPILESNYPDNDVIRVGDTYYMMSSTNHFVPGMVILKSKDLVNWDFPTHMPAPITFDQRFAIGRNQAKQGPPGPVRLVTTANIISLIGATTGADLPREEISDRLFEGEKHGRAVERAERNHLGRWHLHRQHRSGRDVGYGDQAGVARLRWRGNL